MGRAAVTVEAAADGLIVRRGDAVVRPQVWDERIARVRHAGSGRMTEPAVSATIENSSAVRFEPIATPGHVGDQTIHGPVQAFVRQPVQAFVGLHYDRLFNYSGTRVRLCQENTKIGVPVLTSSPGYTLLWNNPAVTTSTSASRPCVGPVNTATR